MPELTHIDSNGNAKMVDVGSKAVTHRTAVAAGNVFLNQETFDLICAGRTKKGDVLTVAQIAGIMGAKKTSELIPLCHPVMLSSIDVRLQLNAERCSIDITAETECAGQTGVEMEALCAVSVAALTVYDMCKAVQRDIVIGEIRLLEKHGGVHGDFVREE